MTGLYWEEWKVGDEYETAERTITVGDILVYAGLSGDCAPVHVDEAFARTTPFGGRIAHGPLVYAIAAGLLFQLHLYDDTVVGFLGFENLRFTKPVKPGDTIRARIKVLETRETSRPDRGVMKRLLQVVNQGGEVVQEGVQSFLILRRPA